jgi:hypothetical protein
MVQNVFVRILLGATVYVPMDEKTITFETFESCPIHTNKDVHERRRFPRKTGSENAQQGKRKENILLFGLYPRDFFSFSSFRQTRTRLHYTLFQLGFELNFSWEIERNESGSRLRGKCDQQCLSLYLYNSVASMQLLMHFFRAYFKKMSSTEIVMSSVRPSVCLSVGYSSAGIAPRELKF